MQYLQNFPSHIAIIMDGNGRWAKQHNQLRTNGHLKGLETARDIIIYSSEIQIQYLTLFAFSSENWRRPKYEVKFLINLMQERLSKELEILNANNIKINFLGNLLSFGAATQDKLLYWQNVSSVNTGMQLNIALNYGGKWDILEACKKIAELVKNNVIDLNDIDESRFEAHLSTSNIPSPDILIRTGKECRVSNFLLWQLSYSELFFSESLWPDFNKEQYLEIIKTFQNRERRFGAINNAYQAIEY